MVSLHCLAPLNSLNRAYSLGNCHRRHIILCAIENCSNFITNSGRGSFDHIGLVDSDAGSREAILKEYNWKDSWFLSFGSTYDINENWTVRAGIANDQGVVGEVSSLSIPDSDRIWYSAGFTYNINQNSNLDFGYTLVDGEKVHVLEQSALVGEVSAYTESGANYFSLQYNYNF